MMRRSYKFRLRPTAKQHVVLGQCLFSHRTLYNAALQERRDAFERVVKKSADYFGARPKSVVNYNSQSAQLPAIRAANPEIARFGAGSERATLRQLDKAFRAFFRRVKIGEAPGYPRFKSADRFDSVTWPSPGDACKWVPATNRVYLQGIGHLRVTAHREVQGRVKTIQVKREGKRWFLILSCDDVPIRPLAPTGKSMGIDVRIACFLARSGGAQVENPRLARASADQMAAAQRSLATKQRGSKNRQRAKETIARRHRKVANQRRDFHHKTALALVREFDVIVVEDLDVKNMTRSAKGTVAPPGIDVAAKAGLNRSSNDAG